MEKKILAIKTKSIIIIQKRIRGILGRKRFLKIKNSKNKNEEINIFKEKIPYYYKLKFDYLKNQNYFHKKFIVIIQCGIRTKLARNKVKFIIWNKKAKIIQKLARLYIQTRYAVKELERLLLLLLMLLLMLLLVFFCYNYCYSY